MSILAQLMNSTSARTHSTKKEFWVQQRTIPVVQPSQRRAPLENSAGEAQSASFGRECEHGSELVE